MHQQTHLQQLEAEAIFIIREVAACFDKPCLLYSIGKDSTVMLHLARKAFWPAPVPFTLLHVDTTWEFAEMGRFRDYMAAKHNLNILVHTNNTALASGIHPITSGSVKYNDQMKTQALKQAMSIYKFDAALGGARRDEEKSRAKERIFSVRDEHQGWNPKNQRPELWNIFNTEINKGESIRVFPLSNWTELDIWQYILKEKIELVSLYFSAPRLSWKSDENGQHFVLDDDRMRPFLSKNELQSIAHRPLRCRTLGCYPQTGAVLSAAIRVEEIIQELLVSKTSEREGRTLDKDQVGSMEKKKREGYF
ncbi:sulfate adenylyltransferase subunit CysD [Cellvibrio sp. QJXJ]|uniref:sulfate adenylyltransferase subunit CysD n=1 Tax=Cellvibrio sp. QJXJ TaxID=2964606 RepID=UPI0021C323CD|nr:sulfate adenylyltransferase subunit CysD [Cellvibrio sp. QJXJ]UUA74984.1 sulfate adenylyltransferase subunit CysD [Cellvibrio sp. QJXJ]